MSPKIFRQISHSGKEISLYWPNFSKEVRHLRHCQANNKFIIIWKKYTNIKKCLKKLQEDKSSRAGEIPTFV